MGYKYIAIEREYGSGGTDAAYAAGKACGVPCYGKEILEAVAKDKGVSVEQIQKYEETATGSFLYTVYMMNCIKTGDTSMLPPEGEVLLAEHEQIKKLACEGPAIFLGHCAAEALKDRSDVATVFICANEEDKIKRIVDSYGIDEGRAESTRKHYDKKRANYYHANTGKNWRDFKNYDVVINTSLLGMDGAVEILKGLFNE